MSRPDSYPIRNSSLITSFCGKKTALIHALVERIISGCIASAKHANASFLKRNWFNKYICDLLAAAIGSLDMIRTRIEKN